MLVAVVMRAYTLGDKQNGNDQTYAHTEQATLRRLTHRSDDPWVQLWHPQRWLQLPQRSALAQHSCPRQQPAQGQACRPVWSWGGS
jgi:hypothetical protein